MKRMICAVVLLSIGWMTPTFGFETTHSLGHSDFNERFTSTAPGWRVNHWGGASFQVSREERSDYVRSGGAQRFRFIDPGNGSAHLIYPFSFLKGRIYRARFSIRADARTTVTAQLRRDIFPWNTSVSQDFGVGTTYQTVEIVGTHAWLEGGSFRLAVGTPGRTIWIDDFQLEEIVDSDTTVLPVPTAMDQRSSDKTLVHVDYEVPANEFIHGYGPGWYIENKDFWNFEIGKETRPEFVYNGSGSQRYRIKSDPVGDQFVHLRYKYPFQTGRTYKITMMMKAEEPAEVEVHFRRDAHPYEQFGRTVVQLGRQWTRVDIQGTPFGTALGSIRVLPEAGKTIYIDDMRILDTQQNALAPMRADQPISKQLFGIHINKGGQNQWRWPDLNQGMVRLWNTGTTWAHIQPEPGPIDFVNNPYAKRLDMYVDYVTGNDPNVDLLYTLGITPRWASASPDAGGIAGPGTAGAPKNLNDWRFYVRTIARRYAGRIKYYELWNEPDYAPAHFLGSIETMIDMARIAREEIKAADPDAQLVSPGLTAGQGYRWLHRFLSLGGAQYIDAVGYHWYYGYNPEGKLAYMRNIRHMMAALDIGHLPLFNTEGSSACFKSPGVPCDPHTEAENRSVNPRALLIMAAAGLSNFNFHIAEGMTPESALISTRDWVTPTVQGEGFLTAADWLDAATMTDAFLIAKDLYVFRFAKDGQRFSIMYTTGGTKTVLVPSGWGASRVQDLKHQTIALPASRILTIGLEPVMVY